MRSAVGKGRSAAPALPCAAVLTGRLRPTRAVGQGDTGLAQEGCAGAQRSAAAVKKRDAPRPIFMPACGFLCDISHHA